MSNKAFLENGGTLKFAPPKNLGMYNKAVDSYPHALEFVFECYKTQKMCNKLVNRCFFCIWFYFRSI